ncbi:MAG TPA: tetratricopeptide repeat protein [Planctomycetota bacterium]|nr:tetratricopeptide repeat protein [Planctomycetota bacterium]
MNRERILFVSVLAILGLWFFLRSPQRPVASAEVGREGLTRRPVRSAEYKVIRFGTMTGPDPTTIVTNVRPHPRPLGDLIKPKEFDLPNIWPPTSRSVSVDRLNLLRRDAAAPQPGPAQIQLPAAAGGGTGAAGISAEERVDAWKSGPTEQKGRVIAIVTGAGQLKEPPGPWPYGKQVMAAPFAFLRLLAQLELDPAAAQQDGVREVHATSRSIKATFRQRFPDEINSFQIAIDGQQQGYFKGLKEYLKVQGGQAFDPRVRAGLGLLGDGLKANAKAIREDLLRWALAILGEAHDLVPAGAQGQKRQVLLAMLRAAGELNDYETVLRLAIDHLDTFPREPEVLEHVGDVMASRTFSLAPFAIEWYRLASDRASAQGELIATLVEEGRFDEAKDLLVKGRAGMPGAEQDLLNARVALALGDFNAATTVAQRHTSGDGAAEAHQILGAVAYAKGDAAAAAEEFQKAAEADPARSTAFSDWGLALAVEGKTEDALLCFGKALELDSIDNAVVPELGRGYLKLAAGEAALRAAVDAEDAGRRESKVKAEKEEEAKRLRDTAAEAFAAGVELLAKLADNNPSDLLVRYMLGYAKERTGNLEEAAQLYRGTIDSDYRYRIAIARLGLVQAQRVLAGGSKDLAPAAVAHLSKAVDLNPTDAILPYLLGRFLMATAGDLGLADRMFEKAGKLEVSERNGDLPLWADLGRSCLAYANENTEVLDTKRLLNQLLERIKESMPAGTTPQKAMEHEVYRAATIDLQIVEDNERKVDRTWDFTELSKQPTDWDKAMKLPMEVRWELKKGLVFAGTINYEGRGRESPIIPLEYCSTHYPDKEKGELNGGNIWELVVTGVTPDVPTEGDIPELGIGVLNPPKPNLVSGVQVRRKRNGNMEIRIDGGDRQVFKNVKNDWVELKKVKWPGGEFTLKFDVVPEYGLARRRAPGRFRLYLNGEEVFLQEFGDGAAGERANVVALSKASAPVSVWLWAEGRDGTELKGIQVKTVTLTVETK